ncbi:unnamed protein product, partial [Prorocentrum cordatum]
TGGPRGDGWAPPCGCSPWQRRPWPASCPAGAATTAASRARPAADRRAAAPPRRPQPGASTASSRRRAECCGPGAALLFPEAAVPPRPAARGPTPSRPHPSRSKAQRRWEARHRRASTAFELSVGGVRVLLHDFKGGWQHNTNYRAYAGGLHDPYDLNGRAPLGPEEVALDVGANLGLVSIVLAARGHFSSRVISLEPHPALYHYLLWNLRENNVTDRVWPLRLGGCDPLRARWFGLWPWWQPREMRETLSSVPRPLWQRLCRRHRARCLSLPQLMRALDLRRVTILKLDCEGCEWGFLGSDMGTSFAAAVRDGRVGAVVGELHHAGRHSSVRAVRPLAQALCGWEAGGCNPFVERCQTFFPSCASFAPHQLSAPPTALPSAWARGRVEAPAPALLRSPAARRAAAARGAVQALLRGPSPASGVRAQRALRLRWEAPAAESVAGWATQALRLVRGARLRRQSARRSHRRSLQLVEGSLLGRAALSYCTDDPACVAQLASEASELLRRAAAHRMAARLLAALRPSGAVPWASPWQMCSRYVRGLRTLAEWQRADLQLEAASAVGQLADAMRNGFPEILDDLRRIRKRQWPVAYGEDLIRRPSNWTKMLLYDGDLGGPPPHGFPGQPYQKRSLHGGLCSRYAPNTCRILQPLLPGLRHPDLPYLQPDHEQVAFFRLAPGSRISFHQAVQNGRLTLHLCLSGCGGSSRIQVGPRVLRWRQGEVLVFDDSFLHRVAIDPHRERWILHVMAMHPAIDTPEKFAQVAAVGRIWPA